MSKYTLFGQTVEFSKAEDNFYNLQSFLWKASNEIKEAYDFWYESQEGAANVINNCEAFAKETIVANVLDPLYLNLAKDFQLFGVGKDDYMQTCLDMSAIYDVRSDAIEIYNDIQEQLEAEIEEREFNNELRKAGQISFGIGDSIKNAASNAAHGIANSSGNASSREAAAKRREKLYNDFRKALWDSIKESIVTAISNYRDFVNNAQPNSILSGFDRESSEAFLENAKSIPEKREELLVQAFTKCPWNEDIYKYIFERFPQERRNIIAIASNYEIDLTEDINKLLRSHYNQAAKNNEALAIQAKTKIKEIMAELGVEESSIIDEIENDCLERLISGLATADEARCNEMKAELEKYDALPRNKKSFFDRITHRIEAIWAKEDGEIFDNYLMQANLLSVKEVEAGKQYIKEKGRTNASAKYMTALEHCTKPNLNKARKYQKMNGSALSFLKYVGWVFMLLGVVLFFVQEDFSILTQVLPVVVGIVYQVYISGLKKEWSAITIDGTVINPVLKLSAKDFDFSYTKAALADYNKEKQANENQESDGQQ